ncbi:MAG: hypothetical protein HW387_627 [Parachlamydiales bacterium]|nr:hypothetical protein [Parachlamydiales bacterium]
MRFSLPRRLICSAILSLNLPLMAQSADVQYAEKGHESDMEALRRWLNDKRMVTLKELGGDLSLSGEARVEFQDINQTNNGIQQRGSNGATGKPNLAWDVEVNILLDYRTDFTWASVKLEFDNDMGVRSSTVNKLKLEKAYLGGRFIAGDTFTWDAELGRRYLGSVFDSKLEFGSFFDGVLFRLSKAFQTIGDFYFNPGMFLVDDKTNHYGYVAELGMLRIANLGFGAKYSVIDWKKHFPNALKDRRYDYVVQQFLLLYQCKPSWLGNRLLKVYAAGLSNMVADILELPERYPLKTDLGVTLDSNGNVIIPKESPSYIHNKNLGKQNWGWFAGVAIGQLKKAGDFAVEIDYQWLQAQAVPEFDAGGIGRGNAADVGLVMTKSDGSGKYTTVSNAVGSGNYKGFEIDILYAFTNNLSVEENFKWTTTLDDRIGPNIKYKSFEVEFIYAF